MSGALKCDACGTCVPLTSAVEFDVHFPVDEEHSRSGWTDVAVCAACLDKPFREVIRAACRGSSQYLGGERAPKKGARR